MRIKASGALLLAGTLLVACSSGNDSPQPQSQDPDKPAGTAGNVAGRKGSQHACSLVTTTEMESATGLAFSPGDGTDTQCTFVTTAGEDSSVNESSVVLKVERAVEAEEWAMVKESVCDGGQERMILGEAAYLCLEGDPPYISFLYVDLPEGVLSVSEVALGLNAAKTLDSVEAIAGAAMGRL